MGKLNIHDIAGLTRYAIAEGIIESNDRSIIDQPNTRYRGFLSLPAWSRANSCSTGFR